MKLIASVVILFCFLFFAGCSPAPDEIVSLSIGSATAIEGSNLSFDFLLAGRLPDTLWINYHTKNVTTSDSDYSVVSAGRVAIVPGGTRATVEIKTSIDAIRESDETFSLIAENAGIIIKNAGTGTIKDGTLPELKGVFVAGVLADYSMVYWNRDDVVSITPTGHTTIPRRMIVDNNNMYIAADFDEGSRYYVNGATHLLQTALSYGFATGMAISGSDVYLAGLELDNTGTALAMLWKNGDRRPLSKNQNSAAYDVAVDGSDIYVCGREDNNAVYWKNGHVNYLEGNISTTAVAKYITVVNGDVYVVVQTSPYRNSIIRLWKNGVGVTISDSTLSYAAGRIAVSGNDVYVGGTNYKAEDDYSAVYWKNGVLVNLEENAKTIDVSVVNNDLYIVTDGDGNKYWKNGEKILLPDGKDYAIFVVP